MNRLEVLTALERLDRKQVEITFRSNRFLPEIKRNLEPEIKKEKNENPIILIGKIDLRSYLSEKEANVVLHGQITANRTLMYGEYVFSSYHIGNIKEFTGWKFILRDLEKLAYQH